MGIDSRKLRPIDLVRALNSTPLGEVLSEAELRKHRLQAGFRIGDKSHVDLFRYAAWLFDMRHQPPPEPPRFKKHQEELAALLAKAQKGEPGYGWLNVLVVRAGYARVQGFHDTGVILATARQLAEYFSVSERTIRSWAKDGMPMYRESVGNQAALFDVIAVSQWKTKRDIGRGVSEEDLLLEGSGPSSKWLEECRKEKARELKRRNDVEEERLLPASDVAQLMADTGRMLRDEFIAVERAFGEEVGDAIRSALARAEEGWRKAFKQDGQTNQEVSEYADDA
jgi:phage terminase Nu1 subunit (DNA packaging protein)